MWNMHMNTTHIERLQALVIGHLVSCVGERGRMDAAQMLRDAACQVDGLEDAEDEELAGWLAVMLRRLEG
ncbi:MAG: hypothetical protein RL260_425 [Pseudomonadota bacterium]